SGLLNGAAPAGIARVILVGTAALLAFVGAVSALSMARAFGVTLRGSPRDPQVQVHGDTPRPLLITMVLHTAGVLLIGIWPATGLRIIGGAVKLFTDLCPSSIPAA